MRYYHKKIKYFCLIGEISFKISQLTEIYFDVILTKNKLN